MGILSSIASWKIYAAGGLVIAAAAGYAGSQATAWQKDAKYNAMVATHAQAMQAYADRSTAAESEQREQENEWRDARDQIQNDTREQIEKGAVDLAGVTRERERLRQQIARLASGRSATSAATQPAPGSPSDPSQDAIGMFADMLDRHTGELEEVGGYATELKTRGLACEAISDAVTQK